MTQSYTNTLPAEFTFQNIYRKRDIWFCPCAFAQSQIRQEWPGHGAPGLQDCRGAKGQPVIHSHPGGLLEAGEVCVDQ